MRIPLMLLALAAAHGAPTSETALSGPVLGYFFDTTDRAAVPVLGLPGAATWAAPLMPGAELDSARSSPSGDLILAVAAKDGSVLAIDPRRPRLHLVPGASPWPDQILFSPTGASAALYYMERGIVETLRGLPDHVARSRVLSTVNLASEPTAIAIADDGAVFLADGNPGGSTLWLFDANHPQSVVFSVSGPAAATAMPNSHELLIADTNAGMVYRLTGVQGKRTATVLTGLDGLTAPYAIAVSPDGAYAAVADTGGRLFAIDLRTHRATSVLCDCRPDGIQALANGRVFAVDAGRKRFLLEAGEKPRVFFIPERVARRSTR